MKVSLKLIWERGGWGGGGAVVYINVRMSLYGAYTSYLLL